MGSFCDLVAAPVKDAKKLAAANGDFKKWGQAASLKGLSHVNFAVLQHILSGVRTIDVLDDYEPLDAPSGILMRCPDALVTAVAKLRPKDLPAVVKAWCASEELEGYRADEVKAFLVELVAVTQTAVKKKLPVLLFMSGF